MTAKQELAAVWGQKPRIPTVTASARTGRQMTHAEKMKAVIESAIKSNATAWLDRFRQIREVVGPQRLPSARPTHETPKKR